MKKILCIFLICMSMNGSVVFNRNFEKQIPFLYELIEKVDADLEYWKRESYKNSRTFLHLFKTKDYESKIEHLQSLKDKASRLLGSLLGYVHGVESGDTLLINSALTSIKESFLDYNISYFSLEDQIVTFCYSLESEFQECQSPGYLKKHWKSYTAGTVSVAVVASLCHYYSVKQWCQNKIEITKQWYDDGIFLELPGALPQSFTDNIPSDNIELPDVTNFKMFPDRPWLRKPFGFYNHVVQLFQDLINSADGLRGVCPRREVQSLYSDRLLPVAYRAQRKISNAVLFIAGLTGLYVAQKGARGVYAYLYNFEKKVNYIRYAIKKLHQAIHNEVGEFYTNYGTLAAHAYMLRKSLDCLPIEIAQSINEDSIQIENFSTSETMRRKIINRWYKSYLFLKM